MALCLGVWTWRWSWERDVSETNTIESENALCITPNIPGIYVRYLVVPMFHRKLFVVYPTSISHVVRQPADSSLEIYLTSTALDRSQPGCGSTAVRGIFCVQFGQQSHVVALFTPRMQDKVGSNISANSCPADAERPFAALCQTQDSISLPSCLKTPSRTSALVVRTDSSHGTARCSNTPSARGLAACWPATHDGADSSSNRLHAPETVSRSSFVVIYICSQLHLGWCNVLDRVEGPPLALLLSCSCPGRHTRSPLAPRAMSLVVALP